MRVLLTGAGGQVGRAVIDRLAGETIAALTHSDLDICDTLAVASYCRHFQPELIVNAAAFTRVDDAESNKEGARRVNALGPGVLANAAAAIDGCRLIQISTDYVFRGDSSFPYLPNSETEPVSVYGATKREGELAVLRILGERACVLRTAWVYAASGRNFLTTMLRQMRANACVSVVGDQVGSPTAASSVAQAVAAIASRPRLRGTLHWTDDGVVSWHTFARAIADVALKAGVLERPVEVKEIRSCQFPTAAIRPKYSVLDLKESELRLKLKPRPLSESLREEIRLFAARQC